MTVYRQQGRLQRAVEVLAELEPRVRRMLAPGHIAVVIAEASTQRASYLPRFLLRRSELEVQAHRAERAAEDARTALALEGEATEPGTLSSNLGLCHLALGHALRAQGRPAEARAAYAAALQQLEPTLGPDHPATRAARD